VKHLLLIPLLIGLLLQNFSQGLIVLEYKVNFSYIASVLCENRDKPEMHCNGKCHLKKQLKKEEQQERNGASGKEKNEVVYNVHAPQRFRLQPVTASQPMNAFYQDPVLHTPVFSFFHPPQA